MKNYIDFQHVAKEQGLLRAIYIARVHSVKEEKLGIWITFYKIQEKETP